MDKQQSEKSFFEFGPFLLDEGRRRLLCDGADVPLTPKEFQALLLLVRQRGEVVGREELLDELWADTNVEPGNLAVHISSLRKKLGRGTGDSPFIETEPRRGYRFTASVREVGDADLVLKRRTHTHIVTRETEESVHADSSGAAEVTTRRSPRISNTVRLGAVATVIAAAVLALILYFSPGRDDGRGRTASAPPIRSLAVLPFTLMDAKGEDEYLGLGLTDALITRLGNVRQITVRPTSAVSKFTAPGRDAATVGRQLGVEAVLEGNIQKAGNRLRVTAQLVRVSDGAPLWAGTFDEPATNVFAVQDAISEQLAAALAWNLTGGERAALTRRYTESADAFYLYAKGRHHWNKRNAEGMTNAEKFFRQAIDRDPNFALAYVGLADTLAMGQGNRIDFDRASVKAIELDPNLGEVYATRGFINMFHNWNWRKAEEDLRRAVELSPNYGTAHQWLATLLAITGRVEEAKTAMRRALEIDPLSPNFLADMGQMHYFAREYEEAERYCRRALEVSPDFGLVRGYLKQIYLKTNRHDEAFAENLQEITAAFSDSKYPNDLEDDLLNLREIYRRSGMRGVWRHWNESFENTTISDPSIPYGIAINYALLGEKEEALHWLELAVERRPFMMAFVGVDPYFDDLRPDPRFQRILQRMGLAEQQKQSGYLNSPLVPQAARAPGPRVTLLSSCRESPQLAKIGS